MLMRRILAAQNSTIESRQKIQSLLITRRCDIHTTLRDPTIKYTRYRCVKLANFGLIQMPQETVPMRRLLAAQKSTIDSRQKISDLLHTTLRI